MRAARFTVISLIALSALAAPRVETAAPQASAPLYQQFLSNPNPLELVAAKKVDRIAWTVYEEGKRNAYTAVAPAFTPVRLTQFLKDEGTDIAQISISDDGSTVVFCRGTVPNRDGWVANASADPNGAERAIWAVKTAGGAAWRVAEGTSPQLSPDGSSVLFVKEGEIYRARVTPVKSVNPMDRGEKPFIRNWGTQSAPRWSPDGKKIAFVSNRDDHSFIAVYDLATRGISYMAPSVDFDNSPMWTEDGKHIVFFRRPGLPFGQQGQQGGGGIGIPNGPAFNPNQGRGGRGNQDAVDPAASAGRTGGRGQDPGSDARDVQGRLHASRSGRPTWRRPRPRSSGTTSRTTARSPTSTTRDSPATSSSFPSTPAEAGGGRGRGQQPAPNSPRHRPARPTNGIATTRSTTR